MKIKKLLLCLSLTLVFNACKKSDPTPTPTPDPTPVTPPITTTPYVPDNSFKIVAYMPGYRDPETVDISKYKMITHLFYAFLTLNSNDGSLVPFTATENQRFTTVMNRAKANNVKFGISVSGTSSVFAAMAAIPASRTRFVTDVVAFATNNNLSGVDMDWEYPTTTASIASAHNYTLLMQELSIALHNKGKFLSAAVTPGVYTSGNQGGVETEVFPSIDFFNIMQYDGPGYDTTEPLNHASYKMTVASMDFWLINRGLPEEKAILGMPLYGESSGGATSIGYRNIEASGADVNLNVATVAGTAYGYNGIPLIKQKTQLAKDRGNGIMFWEFSFDSNTSKSLIKAANDQLGRAY